MTTTTTSLDAIEAKLRDYQNRGVDFSLFDATLIPAELSSPIQSLLPNYQAIIKGANIDPNPPPGHVILHGQTALPAIAGVQIDANFAVADGSLQLVLSLSALATPEQPIDLKRTLTYVAKGSADALPALAISQLGITIDTAQRGCAVSAGIVGEWPINLGSAALALTGLSIDLSRTSATTAATLTGSAHIGDTPVELIANYPDDDGSWSFAGGLAEGAAISLNALLGQVLPAGTTLPEELPAVDLSELSLELAPKTGRFSLRAKSTTTAELKLGMSGLNAASVEVSLKGKVGKVARGQQTAGEFSGQIVVGGTGPFEIAEGCQFEGFSFNFELADKQTWQLSGNVQATLFDAAFELEARLKETAAARTVTLETKRDKTRPLVSFGDSGQLSASNLKIAIEKRKLPRGATPAPGTSLYSWSMAAAGRLVISDRLRSDGSIRLFKNAQTGRAGLVFESKDTSIEFKLPKIVDKTPKVELAITRIEIVRTSRVGGAPGQATDDAGTVETGESGVSVIAANAAIDTGSADGAGATPDAASVGATATSRSRWEFKIVGKAKLRNLPPSVQTHIAPEIDASMKANSDGVSFTIGRLVAPFEFPLRTQLADQKIDLGKALVDASNFNVKLGTVNEVTCDIGVGLPEQLNLLFGVNDDGAAAIDFFNTYRHTADGSIDEDSITKLRVGLNTAGLSVQIVTSPIAAIALRTDQDGKTWCDAKLGQPDQSGLPEFGQLSFEVPIFMYDGVNFKAEGWFTHENLKLPLTPLKMLLEACDLDALSSKVPRGLPLKGIHAYDAVQGLRIDRLIEELQDLSGGTLPSSLADALHALDSLADTGQALLAKLPARFTDYLNFDVPQSINFDISIGVDGSARGSIDVGDQPLKMLYPGALFTTGVELKRLAFGEILSGALFRLDLDAHVDQFDLPSLVAALALPEDQDVLPKPSTWSRRFTASNLFALVVYETVVPIPIPIFFDELAIEYLGLEGVEFESHFSFPQPQVNFGEIIKLFKDMGDFFTKPDYRLPTDKKLRDVDLRLTVGPNYLQMPKYLTNGQDVVLGTKAGLAPISAYDKLAHLLNGLKFLSTYELMQLIPWELRHGSQQVSLACLNIGATWLLTSPREFREHSQELFGIAAAAADTALDFLPTRPARDDTGLIVFLQGGWNVPNVTTFDARFGLAADSSRFATAMQIAGRLSDIVAIDLRGKISAGAQSSPHFTLDGTSRLDVLGENVFNGKLSIRDNRFAIDGTVNLFPFLPGNVADVGGELHGHLSDTDFDLAGDMHVILGGYELLSGQGRIDGTGASLIVHWLGQTATFAAVKIDGGMALQAALEPIDLARGAFRLTGASGSGGPIAYVRARDGRPALYAGGEVGLLDIVALGGEVSFAAGRFSVDVDGKVFGVLQAHVHADGGDLLNGDDFQIAATLSADFQNQLTAQLRSEFTGRIDQALRLLPDAQELVSTAQEAVRVIEGQIAEVEQEIRHVFDTTLGGLQKAVDLADQQVKALKHEIESAKNAAHQSLSKTVTGLQADIDERHDKLDDFGADVVKLGFEIAGLEIAKGVVGGVVEIVDGTLDTSLSVLSELNTALTQAEKNLAQARANLAAMKTLAQMIQEDDTLQRFLNQLNTEALPALNQAKGILQGLSGFLGGALAMLNAGLGGLVSVESASFSGTLNAVRGGQVELSISVSLMSEPAQSYTVSFDFHSLEQSLRELVEAVLPDVPALPSIVRTI